MAKQQWTQTQRSATKLELEDAWKDRLADAKALLAANRGAWSIASALYAVEIHLKVLVCKNLDLDYLPAAVFFHDLSELLILAGLSRRITEPALTGVKMNWDQILSIAGQLEDLRYRPAGNWSVNQAGQFLAWLEDPTTGVLTWLSTL